MLHSFGTHSRSPTACLLVTVTYSNSIGLLLKTVELAGSLFMAYPKTEWISVVGEGGMPE